MRRIFYFCAITILIILAGCSDMNKPVDFRLLITEDLNNRLGPCG
jgi:hypothetical protein